MARYNPKFHHRRSIRLPKFDYTQPGAYFITINAYKGKHIFGEVIDGVMRPNPLGRIVQYELFRLAQRFRNMSIDAFVVMPNHIHVVIVIHEHKPRPGERSEGFGKPVRGSIPTIIRTFKARVTRRAKRLGQPGLEAIWHRGYWDRVIRNERHLNNVRRYIERNPEKWDARIWGR